MSSVRSDPGYRLLRERFSRTNSGNLELDLNLARDELRRERSRERRWRGHIEDDDRDYYKYVYEDDDPGEIARRRRRSIERRPLSPPHADLNRIIVRPMGDLHEIPSSPPASRSGTRSSAPSQARGPVVSIVSRYDRHDRHDRPVVRVDELDRIRRDNDRLLRENERLRSSYLATRIMDPSRSTIEQQLNATLLHRPIARPRGRTANPSGKPVVAPIEVPPTASKPEPSPEAKIRNELLDFLWSPPVGLIHDHLSKLRVKSTGEWIFTHAAFESWRKAAQESPNGTEKAEKAENCLLLQGGLGAGKTMLMNAIISRLSSEVTKEPENIVVYYYFDRSSSCKPYQAISSLLRQICDQKDIPLPKFLAEMETKGLDVAHNIGDNDGIQLANLVSDFLSIQSRFKRVYVCLDGLEECDDLLTLIQILRRISAVQDIRLVLTSRSRIVEQFVAVSIGRKETVVQLEDHNSQDIRLYLESFLKCQRHSYLSDMIGKETRSGLLNQLIEKSGGNFLSAVAQVAQLNRLSSLAEVTDQLEKPPLQLSEVIDLILSRFNDQSPQRSQLALRVFYWLAVARRPLTLRELQQAVAAEPGGNIDDPNRLSPPSVIKTVCMGLVHIDVEKNRVFTTPSALPFYLYQFGNEFARQAREYAAVSCLAFLQSDTVSHGPFTSQSQYDEMEKKLPFANYVSQNWGVHLNDDRDEESVNKVLENDSLLETLSQLLHVTSQPASVSPRPYDDYPRGFGGRHFGSYFGLTSAFKNGRRRRTGPFRGTAGIGAPFTFTSAPLGSTSATFLLVNRISRKFLN